MLRQATDLKKLSLDARDGEVGVVRDLYFDDASWTVRYLVADTAKWLAGRRVLLSPFALRGIDEERHRLVVDLTREQIEKSPPADSDKPVSRQYEEQYYRYYGWPHYWEGPWLWGPGAFPALAPPPAAVGSAPVAGARPPGDPHLRSMAEVTGYSIQARDDKFGHVEEFIIDDEDWAIRYIVIDPRNWWPGKHVLIVPQWISAVRWRESELRTDLDQETIKSAPEYDRKAGVTREYEERLFNHYKREGYWLRRQHADV